MPRKKKNNANFFKPVFSEILVCQDTLSKPYIESFFQEPENLTQKKLGFLFGVLEVTDNSEDSSYIVNFLISIIKKEFYKNTKRGSIESLEASLHKANLALSKLAQHENVNWINNIHATVGIFEKNNLHISSAGRGTAIIVRKNVVINLNEENKDSKTNPLKTFEDIVSGKIEEKDKLIVSTPEIFEIFSEQEIKKSSQKFSRKKFIRFLKTALSNEVERISTLILDFCQEEKISQKNKKTNTNKVANVFSQKAFIKSKEKSKTKKELIKEDALKDEINKNHLYIKENINDLNIKKINQFNSQAEKTKDNFLKIKKAFFFEKNFLTILREKFKKIKIKNNLSKIFSKIKSQIKTFFIFTKNIFLRIKSKIKKAGSKISRINFSKRKSSFRYFSKKKFSFLLPSIKKTIRSFNSLSQKKKIVSLFIVIFIFVAPILFTKKESQDFSQKEKEHLKEQSQSKTLPKEEKINETKISYVKNNSLKEKNETIVILNNSLFILGEKYLFDIKKNKEISIPENISSINSVVAMNDLNLLFLMTQDKKIITYSPIPEKFQDNIIDLPESKDLEMIGSFMTYLYILDKENNQIYRFPRKEGGFGEKTNWLKEATDLSTVSLATINDNIFLLSQEKIFKFFRGKKEPFSIPEKIKKSHYFFTNENDENIYIIDKNNKKIFILDNNGKVIQEFYNKDFEKALQIQVDSKNKKIYLLLEGGDIIETNF